MPELIAISETKINSSNKYLVNINIIITLLMLIHCPKLEVLEKI